MKDILAFTAWLCCLALTRATLTVIKISGASENLDRPCPGDTVVYTCTVSGTTLQWYIPGLFDHPLAYTVGFPETFVGSVLSDQNSLCESNLTAIGANSLTSTLTVTASNDTVQVVQNGSTIVCSGVQSQEFVMDLIITSPPSAPVCSSFTPSSAGEGMIDVVFNWTAPFDGGESIDHYQVTPPTDPCGSPVTSTSNQYRCSGLRMDEMYNFIVRAVNCNNQEGPESGTITVTPQVPIPPSLYVCAEYNRTTQTLQTIESTWNEVEPILRECGSIQDGSLNYTISYESGSGPPTTFNLNPQNCSNSKCQHLFPVRQPASYNVFVAVRNVVGQSISNTSFVGDTNTLIVNVDTTDTENAFVVCRFMFPRYSCTIDYGTDPSYTNLVYSDASTTLGQVTTIALSQDLQRDTIYYFIVTANSSSRCERVRGRFRTECTVLDLGITGTQLGTDPRCTDRQFESSLPISNGLVCYCNNETTAMSEAFYICNDNFTLMGDATRVCQNDGNWNGSTPQCIPANSNFTDGGVEALTTGAAVGIAVVTTAVVVFMAGVLTGALVYHCISKHRSQSSGSKPDSSSRQQQQAGPQYEEVSTTSAGEKIELKGNMAYEPVKKIETRENVPIQH